MYKPFIPCHLFGQMPFMCTLKPIFPLLSLRALDNDQPARKRESGLGIGLKRGNLKACEAFRIIIVHKKSHPTGRLFSHFLLPLPFLLSFLP